jgi:ribosomal protein L32
MVSLAAALLLGILALVALVAPFFRQQAPKAEEHLLSPADELRREKEGIYLAIREVEFDYRTGKVSEEDYTALMTRYRARAIDLMKAIEQIEGAHRTAFGDAVEVEIRASLAADPRTAAPLPTCPECGATYLPAHRFCTRCGQPLPEDATSGGGEAPRGVPS